MGLYSFRLPDIGEGIAEAEIVTWHVTVGDKVSEDSPLADMMTDKATVEMESPVTGVVVELAGEVGDKISIGSTLAVIEIEDDIEAGAEQVEDEAKDDEDVIHIEPENTVPNIQGLDQSDALEEEASVVDVPLGTPADINPPAGHRKTLASPAVRARARDLGIDLDQLSPQGDRVRHADLDAFLRYGSGQGYRAPTGVLLREDRHIKVIGLRRKIAENMAAAKRAIPHFTYVEEINVTALEKMRADLNETRGNRPKLTMLPLLIAAICRTVPEFPMINARYDDAADIVTQHGSIHVGMATQTDGGLMVPVIRDAQALNIWQLANEIKRLSEAARNGKATLEELSGSTLTLTSLGPLGGIATTPVINRPEVAIIGPNRIVERPIFVTNQRGVEEICKAQMMNISISCDHRVVDGWDAASFVQALKRVIEMPIQLFAA